MVAARRILGGGAQPVALFGADGEPLVAADFGGGGGGSGGEVTQGTNPWVTSMPTLIALIGEVDPDPSQYTLLERLKQIDDGLAGLLSAVPKNSVGTELFTVGLPGQVTQAALAVGVDKVAGPQVSDLSGTATASGETTLITPASGNFIRLWWFSYQLTGDTAVTASLRYGASNTDHYATNLPSTGAYVSHQIKPNYKPLAINEALIINLSGDPSTGAGGVLWNIEYEEVAP